MESLLERDIVVVSTVAAAGLAEPFYSFTDAIEPAHERKNSSWIWRNGDNLLFDS